MFIVLRWAISAPWGSSFIIKWNDLIALCFYTPVFRWDDMVSWMLSIGPSVRVSVWVSVRLLQFSTLFSYMLWQIELKFCMWLYFTVLQIKFKCCQFVLIFVGVNPVLELKVLEIHSFPQFSPTCFDILRWNFAYDFVLLYFKFECRQFLYNCLQTGRIIVWWYLSGSPFGFPSVSPRAYMYWKI